MKTSSTLAGLLVALAASQSMTTRAQSPAGLQVQLISTFDYPGDGNQTIPQKVNDQGDIIGGVQIGNGTHGFILFPNGRFTQPITDPNDTGNFTIGAGINNSQLGCGFYVDDSTQTNHGFFLMSQTITNYDVAGSTATTLYGVNTDNDFCGSATVAGVEQGFVSLAGLVTEFAVADATFAIATALNDSDQICGLYADSRGIEHGFYRDPDGTIHAPVDPRGSRNTNFYGNNNRGTMVGRFSDSTGTHALVFLPPNKFISYSYPGANFTSFGGINNHGEIVGRYSDATGNHGLIAQLVRE